MFLNNKLPQIQPRKLFLYLFIASFAVCFFAYGIFIQPHYSSDTYANLNGIDCMVHLTNGRIFAFIIQSIFNLLGIDIIRYQGVFAIYVLFFISLSVAIILCKLISFNSNINQIEFFILILAAHLIFINVFISEWFLYVESYTTLGIGVFTCVLSCTYVSALKFKKLLIGFLLLNISLNLYQIYIELFLAISMMFLIFQYRNRYTKRFYLHFICILGVGGSASIINILLFRLLQHFGVVNITTRNVAGSLDHIWSNIQAILRYQKDLWLSTYSLLPHGVLIFTALILFCFVIIQILFYKEFATNKLFILVLCCFVLWGITFSPHILSQTMWLPPRTLPGVFCIIPLISVIFVSYKSRPNIQCIAAFVLTIFLFVNAYHIQGIATNTISNNKLDFAYALSIGEYIDGYEQNSGNTVQYVGVLNDSSPTYSYPGIKYVTHDMNIRASVVSWSKIGLLNLATKRNLSEISVPDNIYDKYFAEKNWSSYVPDEQIVFEGNTAYICSY